MENSHLRWAIEQLKKDGYQLQTSTPDIVQKNAWSIVYRFQTNRGFVFLKKVPPALSIESKVINILTQTFQAHVPCIIATNEKEHCFLMEDAGIPLRQFFKEKFKADIFIQTMKDYIALQINATDKIDLFFNIGVPDWRLEKLPKLYQDIIENESLLLHDGLSKDELILLKKLKPNLFSICDKLSHYEIKDTFGHADFHDKNILIDIDSLQTTVIDLGEVVITHPFFSLHNCLHMAKENFSLTNSQYQDLQIQCFKPWLECETEEHLLEILNTIQLCWSIHAVLGDFRLLNSIDLESFHTLSRQGRLAKKLRHWINQ